MTIVSDDLGDLEQLATAIGLIDADGDFREDWLSRPEFYLTQALASDTQRGALITFVDEVLGGAQQATDAQGRIWLPIVETGDPDLTFSVVVDESPATHVRMGLGVVIETSAPASQTRLHLPLFRAAKGTHHNSDPLLLGKNEGAIGFSTEITVDSTPPAPGAAHLGRVGLSLEVPTATGSQQPSIALTLGQLQLPGASTPHDLVLSLDSVDTLDDQVLEIVLGLIQAQAGAAAATPLAALAGLLGLRNGVAVPALPVASLVSQGPAALAQWFDQLIGSTSARAAWLGQLAQLLGSSASVVGDTVTWTVGSASIVLGVTVQSGAAGRSQITPTLGVQIASGNLRAQVDADLVRLDLGDGSAIAVPRLSATATAGQTPSGGAPILTGDPTVGAVRVGVALNQARRPVVILAADQVTIGSNSYDTLDLSTPDAIADTIGTAIGDAVDDLLGQLGPVGTAIRPMLGLAPPPGFPAVPTVTLSAFMANPLMAVGGYWRTLVRDHATAVPALIGLIRPLLADATAAVIPVAGTGTAADPWRMSLIGPVELQLVSDTANDTLAINLAVRYIVDDLGLRCTRVQTRVAVGLLEVGLSNGQLQLAGRADVRLTLRARGSTQARFALGSLLVSADHIGFAASWTAALGLSFDALAPNLAVEVSGQPIPVGLPSFNADGTPNLDDAGYDAVERLLGLLAMQSSVPAFAELALALGWVIDEADLTLAADTLRQPRLRLADLVNDPATALPSWIKSRVFDTSDGTETALSVLSRLLTGTSEDVGQRLGHGRLDSPYRLGLFADGTSPELALWLDPHGPRRSTFTDVSDALRNWRPGAVGLDAAQLAEALEVESLLADSLAVLTDSRDLPAGLDALISRWEGTDGRIVPPASDPAGVTVHRIFNTPISQLEAGIDVTSLLGSTPSTTLHIAVVGTNDPLPWASVPADRLIDLREVNRVSQSFPVPSGGAGDWFVALAPRADAILASGDPDGTEGQAARLQHILGGFDGSGGLLLLATGGAGHAARLAAERTAAVSALVTLGTPAGPVAFTVLDTPPAADVLRMLHALLPAFDSADPDDADLALGRALLAAFTQLLPLADPAVELRPPATAAPVPRAGLAVHAVFGVLERSDVERALTAVVAAALSVRAGERASQLSLESVSAAGIGVRLPIITAGTDLQVVGQVLVEGLNVDLSGTLPSLGGQHSLVVNLTLRRRGAWLVGGPDPARGPGPRPDHELRALQATLRLPLHGSGSASAEITLLEPRVFGIRRPRWVVSATGSTSASTEVVTPALPEVRVLLAQVAQQLSAATDAQIGFFTDVLDSLSLMDTSGGFNTDAIDHLLYEPAAHVATVMASETDRQALNTAVNGLLGTVSGVTLDIASRQLSLDLSGVPGAIGLAPWRLQLSIVASGPPQFDFSLGGAGTTAAGGIGLSVSNHPFAIKLERHRPQSSTPAQWTLWPSPDAGLATAMLRAAPAELARVGLGYLRDLDEGARPIVDAALDALGLLAPAVADGSRAIVLPLTLLEDPVAWFGDATTLGGAGGLEPSKIIALFDAFKPLLGVSGGSGEWQLASGVSLRASETSGVARLGLQLDTSGFAALPAGPGQLVLSGAVGLRLPANQAPKPDIDLALGMSGASPGRRALHVTFNGGLQVFLRPATGADLSLYPNPPGLGALAQTAVTQALPLILDALGDETGSDLAGDVGTVVRAVGDAMGLRNAVGDFEAAALQTWADDPAGAFAARLTTMSTAMIGQLAGALGPLLPSPATVSPSATGLGVQIGSASIALQTAPFEVAIAAAVSGLAGVSEVAIDTRFDASGLKSLSLDLGPADIDAGGISLRPYFSVAAGASPPGGQRAEIGLALDATGVRKVGGRWLIDSGTFGLVAVDGATIDTDAASVAIAMVETTLQMVASFAMSTTAVEQLLNTTLPGAAGSTVRKMMAGVFLEDTPNPTALDSDLFDPSRLLGRLQNLLVNLAGAGPSVSVTGGLSVGLSTAGTVVQFTLGLTDRFNITEGDLVIALEADSRWIKDTPTAGLSVGLIDTAGGGLSFSPSLSVDGVGIRIGRQTTPLLEAGISLGSVAAHVFARVSASELSGGLQIQLSNLAVGVSGSTGGNPVAQGLVADTGSGAEALEPAFSPAFAIQRHGGGPVLVSLRAGDGEGPWWLSIQKGFGPLYIEQVGLDTTIEDDRLVDISVLLDGGVSIAGLAAAVDNLSLTFVVASDASVFDASRWRVDLAGLAVSADMAGVTLAGGLRKFGSGENVEYIGMLLARFATYGLSVYGGYGTKVVSGDRFTAFFAFGAINGPIGGPPAFFLTGIGGGLGINRDLILPDDLSRFGDFPFIKALDPGASAPSDPMTELVALRDTFPMKRGDFWFAAGLSFTSFALVDGVAVVSVKIGDGLEISLLGLARMALPRPQVALVSIELGLLARFSTKEGVLWIQAQLTDNSWLLHESVRLTGGFAFVSWFDGPNRGQFVLTIGGYHPNFHRDGYPTVPRLGFRWSVSSAIVVKGESYFALTSEAIMAGGKLEASAEFGPAWAHVVFGADGIVYFDPFRFEVSVYASISAGITIDFWIGEITIKIHIGARIDVVGPKIRGVARFEIGPVELSVAFGDKQKAPKVYVSWNEFVPKYLEEARPGVARCITALPGKGALPPGTGPGGATDTATADGSAQKPFIVLSEFEFMITSTVPSGTASFSTLSTGQQAPSHVIGLGPMNEASVTTTLTAALRDTSGTDHLNKLTREIRFADGFPMGVWGNPQPDDDRKLPRGDVIRAIEGGRLEAVASIQGSLPKEMAYKQVESEQRKHLPFVHARTHRATLIAEAGALAAVVPQPGSVSAMYGAAKPWLAKGGNGATALAALERDRSAPPLIGSLTEDLADAEPRAPVIRLPAAVKDVAIDRTVRPPEFIGLLTAEIMPETIAPRTTVSRAGAVERMAPPTMAQVEAEFDWTVPAKLVRVASPASASETTVRAGGRVPLTRARHAGSAAIRTRGAAIDGQHRLTGLTRALVQSARGAAPTLDPGEIAVMCLPNAQRDTDAEAPRPQLALAGGSARVLALASGGRILLDQPTGRAAVDIPRGSERLVVFATGERARKAPAGGLYGWHAGQSMGYLGWATALFAGGTLTAEGSVVRRGRERFRVGWINAAEFVDAASIVTTRFCDPVRTVVVALDDATTEPDNAGEIGLSLSLSGADRERDQQQRPLPPTLISEGNRSYLVYPIAPQGEVTEQGVSVSIAREPGWRLAGVMGSRGDAQSALDQLLSTGLDSLLQPLAASRTGTITLRWKAPIRRRRVPPLKRGVTKVSPTRPLKKGSAALASRKQAAKKPTAKKTTTKKTTAKKATTKKTSTAKLAKSKATKRASPNRKTSKKVATRARRSKPKR